MARTHPLLTAWKPSDGDVWDRTKAAHLLNRAGFGGTPEEIERFVELGPARAVDVLLDFPDAPAEEQSQSDVPDLSAIEGYPRSFREVRKLFIGKTEDERRELRQKLMSANREALGHTGWWWMKRMAAGPHPLQEKLTLFWHGHFTTSALDERSAFLMWQQNELLRRSAAGNFGQFVRDVSRDPAMLDYLNNSQNRKARPNENYARELMELFTLGIGNYTEKDIKEAARAFTGWTHDGDEFTFQKNNHDFDAKTFFGKTGPFDGDDIIAIILDHPVCARYIASKVFSFFAFDADESLQVALGHVLRDAKYEIRPLLRTMFASRAFYDPRAIGMQIKSPVQLVVGTVRTLELEMPPVPQVYGALQQMGQVPLMPPNVKGWPGGRAWINTSTLFVRYNTAAWLAGGSPVPSRFGRFGGGRRFGRNNRPSFNPEPFASADEAVDYWVERLIQRPVPEPKRRVLLDAVGSNPRNEQSIRKLVQLIVSMPEYQLC